MLSGPRPGGACHFCGPELDGNPPAWPPIRNARRIEAPVVNGRYLDRETLGAMLEAVAER